MEELIAKLSLITDAWKKQFQEPYGEYWTKKHFETPPDLPLQWTVDPFGVLWLDHVWICPARFVNVSKLEGENPEIYVTPVSMEIDLLDGTATVIITKLGDEYTIAGVERSISQRGSKSLKLAEDLRAVEADRAAGNPGHTMDVVFDMLHSIVED